MNPLSELDSPASLTNDPNNSSAPNGELRVHHSGMGQSETSQEVEPVEKPIEPPTHCELGLREDYPNVKPGPKKFSPDNNSCWVAFINLPYAGIVICIILLVVYAPSIHGKFSDVIFIFPCIILCLMYLLVVIEAFSSKVKSSLQNAMPVAAFQQKHRKLRLTPPTIQMRALGFEGRGSEKNISHIEDNTFPFSQCIDVSPPMEEFQPATIYRVDCETKLEFLNPEMAAQYKQMKRSMLKRASDDKKKSFQMTLVIPGHKECITVYAEEDCRSCLISPCLYRILVFFLCSWPYRLIFWHCTKKRKYTYVKLINV